MVAKRDNRSEPITEREVLIERIVDAPREMVWKAWTDPRQVVQWWGPTGFTTTIEQMDVRPGGVWQYVMHGPDGTNYPNRSVFIEIVPPERIVYAHGGGAAGQVAAEFEMSWTFEALGQRTRISIHMLFPSAAARDRVVQQYGAIEGGHQTLQRLDTYLSQHLA
jgi:uncharacterized protein YndB with AHSA1/START domain